MDLTKICLETCGPKQIININNEAFNDISNIKIYNDCGDHYDMKSLEYSYSVDSNCWTCFMKYDVFLENIVGLKQDFYLRILINGVIGKIEINNKEWQNYSVQLESSFNLTKTESSPNNYNPYINMDCGIALYQNLTESVFNMIGVNCYYFKLSPNTNSKDLTFKEYALMDVSAVKQIKLIINDNQMPSSKPDFSDFGIDWESDWEVEISKSAFATAFGNTVIPTEGDLVYIPLMKRMWMINGAYEEKKDAFMWNATTFKISLVKYQEKASVDLGETETLVNSFVKNKYEDLFGDEENLDAQFDAVNSEPIANGGSYNVYDSDAIRKYVNTDIVKINEAKTYYKGTVISDNQYEFLSIVKNVKTIEYQQKYCGNSGTLSFIIMPNANSLFGDFVSNLISIGNIIIKIKQNTHGTTLTCVNNNSSIVLKNNVRYLVFLRWDKVLNICDFGCAEYRSAKNVPVYQLQPAHYIFDIDNLYQHKISKYNIEMNVPNKQPVIIYGLYGGISNIKLFDIYNDNISEICQMYPTHHHLIINDTVRQLNNVLSGSSFST